MEPKPTILAELENYLKRESLTITQFAEHSGLHPGTLSNVLHGRRPIAMQQLDPITSAMGLADGFFYDLYIDNYIIDGSPNWRRIGPLLHRCAELNKLDAIQRVVQHILENLMYLPLLFDKAEELFAQEHCAAAALLYKSVAEGEKSQHSERLAFCHYRLFRICLGEDQNVNLRAANQFEPHVERLDEADQLDALKHLMDVYASTHRWDKLDELAELLGQKAAIQYQHVSKKNSVQKQPERPYIYYILYADLMRSLVCDELGEYDQALYFASLYSDTSWVKPPVSEREQKVIDQFKEWATANIYLYRLMAGEVEVLTEYINYVESRENEIFPALFKITQIANQHKLNIDDILLRLKSYLSYREQKSGIGVINQQVTGDRHTRLMAEVGVYYLRTERFDNGLGFVLESLEASININNDSVVLRCLGLFEQFRHFASDEARERYKILRKRVEKQFGLSTRYM